MRTKDVTTLLVPVLVALAVAGCAQTGQASEDDSKDEAAAGPSGEKDRGREATLKLEGEPGTEFSGSCGVGDEEPEEISGQVPESYTYELERRPLECRISSEGGVRVELAAGENTRSVQQISGGTLKLTYEKGSISSVVSSSAGSGRRVSSSSSGTTAQETSDTTNEPGNVASESRDVSNFNEVELQGLGSLSIEQADEESLTVEAEEDVLPKIRTEVKNDRLIIGPTRNTSINTSEPISYELTVKDLSALKVSGSGDVEAEGISADELAVTMSGTGDVQISGKVGSQKVDISGSGDYKAGELESTRANVDVGGSGSALVNASDELEAKVSGSGSVEYIGDPTVEQDVSGSGEVEKD